MKNLLLLLSIAVMLSCSLDKINEPLDLSPENWLYGKTWYMHVNTARPDVDCYIMDYVVFYTDGTFFHSVYCGDDYTNEYMIAGNTMIIEGVTWELSHLTDEYGEYFYMRSGDDYVKYGTEMTNNAKYTGND